MDVHSASRWFGFTSALSGDGAETATAEVLSLSSGVGTGSAKRTKRVKLSPGERVRFSCLARRISGSDATSGELSIDWPADGTSLRNRVRVTSSDWQDYSIEYAAPFTADDDDYAALNVGVFTSDGGQVEYAFPRIAVEGTKYGAARVFCAGMIFMDLGTPSVSSSFIMFGIRSVVYDAATKTLTVTMDPGVSGGGTQASPLFFTQVTPDASAQIYAKAGIFDRTNGTLIVKFTSTVTGAFVDVAANQFYFQLLGVI
jgi:hypothetical protein